MVYVISGCFANIGQELFYYLICGFAFACASVTEQRYSFFQAQQAELARGKARSEIAAAKPSSTSVPAAVPVVGRPPAITLEDQYGDVPWAKSPQKPG